MSERVAKVESLIQQVAATSLSALLEGDAAYVTITRVDAAPDLRNATVWIGLLAEEAKQATVWDRLQHLTAAIQADVAARLTMKYVPRLHFKLDTGGAYAAEIDRLLKDL